MIDLLVIICLVIESWWLLSKSIGKSIARLCGSFELVLSSFVPLIARRSVHLLSIVSIGLAWFEITTLVVVVVVSSIVVVTFVMSVVVVFIVPMPLVMIVVVALWLLFKVMSIVRSTVVL